MSSDKSSKSVKKITTVNSTNFQQEILGSTTPVVIDFGARWCSPCKALKPLLELLSAKYPNVKFVYIDYDTSSDLIELFNVDKLPTLLIVNRGKQIGRYGGVKTEEEFLQMMRESGLTI